MKGLSKIELSRFVAIGIWLAFIIIRTGTNGIMAIWDVTIFGAFLLAVTSLTRTVRLRTLLSMFALGGFVMGVEAFISIIILPTSNMGAPTIRAFFVPIMENAAFLIPPAVLLWRKRPYIYSFGASDVMLLMAASASGFFLMEDAFIRLHGDWHAGPVFFAPSITHTGNRLVGDYLCVSQPVWGAIAGIAVGLALFSRVKSTTLFWPIVAAGIGLGVFDHFANNYVVGNSKDALRALNTAVMLNGWLPMVVFFAGLAAGVAVDLWINFINLPKQLRLRGLFDPQQHALAYEHFYAQNMTGDDKYRAEVVAGIRLAYLMGEAEPGKPAPAVSEPASAETAPAPLVSEPASQPAKDSESASKEAAPAAPEPAPSVPETKAEGPASADGEPSEKEEST